MPLLQPRSPSAGVTTSPALLPRAHLPAWVGAPPGPPPRRPCGLRPAGRPSRGPAPCPRVPAVPPAVQPSERPSPPPLLSSAAALYPGSRSPLPACSRTPRLKGTSSFCLGTPSPSPGARGRVAHSPSEEPGRQNGGRPKNGTPPFARPFLSSGLFLPQSWENKRLLFWDQDPGGEGAKHCSPIPSPRSSILRHSSPPSAQGSARHKPTLTLRKCHTRPTRVGFLPVGVPRG